MEDDVSLENKLPQKDSGNTFGRRGFFQRMAGAAAAIVAGGPAALANINISSANSLEKPQEPDEGLVEKRTKNGVEFVFDKEGKPLSYKLPDGQIVEISQTKLAQARERAVAAKEPEIVSVTHIFDPNPNKRADFKPSEAHPSVTELPEDVVGEEELLKRGIKIIQSPNIKLYIREGAFVKGELLEDYTKGSEGLIIVLVDDPGIADRFLTDERYNSVRPFLLGLSIFNLQQEREIAVTYLENELILLRRAKKDPSYPQRDIDYFNFSILHNKVMLQYLPNIPLEEFRSTKISSNKTPIVGKYNSEPISIDGRDTTVAFVSLRDSPRVRDVVVYADEQGGYQATVLENDSFTEENRLGPALTHPNPSDIPVMNSYQESKQSASSYPYDTRSVGFTLRHELAHGRLTTGAKDRGEEKNEREDEADYKAIEGIRNAWHKWVDSGYKDDGGYYFVVSLPEGGYILTENNKPTVTALEV